jgi:hypothetical protein
VRGERRGRRGAARLRWLEGEVGDTRRIWREGEVERWGRRRIWRELR